MSTMQTLGSVASTTGQDPLTDLENLWSAFDTIFDGLTPKDWRRKHGKDWTIADVPYHLYYFDRDLGLGPLQRGRAVPMSVRTDVPQNVGQLNAWNARYFSNRAAGETPQDSMKRWREVREQIRDIVVGLDNAALEQPVFVPLMGAGWMSTRAALAAALAHHWNHLTQLRLYLKLRAPIENDSVRHTGLAFYMGFFHLIVRADTVDRPFTFTMNFSGPGGGAWTFRVAEGHCTSYEGYAPDADLVMTQSPETFIKTFAKMHNPMLAMLTGQVKVRGLRHMGTFARLMPPETDEMSLPANVVEPVAVSAGLVTIGKGVS